MFNETSYPIECDGLAEAAPPYVPPYRAKDCFATGTQVYCPPTTRQTCAPGHYFDQRNQKCLAYKSIGPQPIDPGGVVPAGDPPATIPAPPATEMPAGDTGAGFDIGGLLGGIPLWALAIGAYFLLKR